MTGYQIKAVPQRAYGYRFLSTLEAKWATFLTEAGFDWEYEPEGYQLPSGWYRPDFRVTVDGQHVWVEVKPVINTEDDPRWAELAEGSGMLFFAVRGMHRSGDCCETAHSARVWAPDGTVADVHRLWQGRAFSRAWDAASSAEFGRKGHAGRMSRRKGRRGKR